jgi:hypothetical protein
MVFDLDANLGCDDGQRDYGIARGHCDHPETPFVGLLALNDSDPPTTTLCLKADAAGATGFEVDIIDLEVAYLAVHLRALASSFESSFTTPLPRSMPLEGLVSGVDYDMRVTMTDRTTRPVSAKVEFAFLGETTLLLGVMPSAVIDAETTFECDSTAGASVVLDGSASFDRDSSAGIVSYEWLLAAGTPGEELLGTSARSRVILPLGANEITLRVTSASGLSGISRTVIHVQDTTAPTLTVHADPSILWPPDGGLVSVHLWWEVSDRCDPDPRVALVSVTSAAEDDTVGDVMGADLGKADKEMLLRATRSGRRDLSAQSANGRTYVLAYAATDQSGNTVGATTGVVAPHDRRRAERLP